MKRHHRNKLLENINIILHLRVTKNYKRTIEIYFHLLMNYANYVPHYSSKKRNVIALKGLNNISKTRS